MRKSLLGVLAALFILSSCSEDVDLTAPYKDITVVYGLLDAKQDTHWIRIQKAFLGDDNALLYTVIPDSLYYPATLDAYILGFNSSNVQVDSFHLERLVNAATKDSGLFAAFNNVLYRGVKTISSANTYKLVIIKPNGDTTSSTTQLTGNIIMAYPPTSATPLDWEPTIVGQSKTITVRWVSDLNSYAYQLGFTFHYQEWNQSTPGNVTDTSFTYYFPMFRLTSDFQCFGNQVCYEITKEQYYDMIIKNIEEEPASVVDPRLRKFISIDFAVLQATEELYNYITINAPSLSYVQKVTAYTNVTNGLGIFAARSSGGVNNLIIDTQTKDSLIGGQYTYKLNFQP